MSWLFGKKDTNKELVASRIGNIGTGRQQLSLLEHLEDVRKRIQRTGSMATNYNKKSADLSSLNETLTKSYIQNLNVIVDISTVLNEYKAVMETVMTQLQSFDNSISDNLRGVNVEHIRDLTSDKLRRVNDFFNSEEFSRVRETLVSNGNTEAANEISKTYDSYKMLQTRAPEVYAELKKGGRKKQVVRKIKKC